MNLVVNGEPHETVSENIAELLAERQPTPPFAIAVNQQFVPQTLYGETKLNERDEIEIVSPMSGG